MCMMLDIEINQDTYHIETCREIWQLFDANRELFISLAPPEFVIQMDELEESDSCLCIMSPNMISSFLGVLAYVAALGLGEIRIKGN